MNNTPSSKKNNDDDISFSVSVSVSLSVSLRVLKITVGFFGFIWVVV